MCAVVVLQEVLVLTADLCSRSAAGGPVLKGGEASLVGPFAEHLSDLIDARFFFKFEASRELAQPSDAILLWHKTMQVGKSCSMPRMSLKHGVIRNST